MPANFANETRIDLPPGVDHGAVFAVAWKHVLATWDASASATRKTFVLITKDVGEFPGDTLDDATEEAATYPGGIRKYAGTAMGYEQADQLSRVHLFLSVSDNFLAVDSSFPVFGVANAVGQRVHAAVEEMLPGRPAPPPLSEHPQPADSGRGSLPGVSALEPSQTTAPSVRTESTRDWFRRTWRDHAAAIVVAIVAGVAVLAAAVYLVSVGVRVS